MQTFLPYPDFERSAQVLDYRRLGKQRVEGLQILGAIHNISVRYPNIKTNGTVGWKNHPATNMWRGYEKALVHYVKTCCLEWIGRGYKDTRLEALNYFFPNLLIGSYGLPDWFGLEKFHSSHRAALLAKNFQYYKQFGWTENPEINYMWSSKSTTHD